MPKHGSRKRLRSSSGSGSGEDRRRKRRRAPSTAGSSTEVSGGVLHRKPAKAASQNGSPPRKLAKAGPDRPDKRSRSRRRDGKEKWRERTKSRERERARSGTSSAERLRKAKKERGREKEGEKEKPSIKDARQTKKKSPTRSKKASKSRSAARVEKEAKGVDVAARGTREAQALPRTDSGGISSSGGAKPLTSTLGDLAELQKGLAKERGLLQLFVLRAKQELEEQKETKEKKERREREYFKAEFGEPCGPKNQLLLEEELGKGAFSTVFKCRDVGVSGKEYAIKFIRANAMLRKATEKEIRLMRRLRSEASEQDPEGARCFLGLAGPETFEHNGHLALVFHLQRCDLRSGLQKYGQGRGLPLPNVRSYTRDIFMALRALRKVNIIHSDLKPDNLLMSMDKSSVKLSDFGSAMDISERIRTDYVQPRFYRAPEIILGQSYGPAIDIWSAGATVYELATGRILFTGKSNNGMVYEMLKVCGAFSKRLATTGDFAAKHFSAEGDFRLKEPTGEKLLPAGHFKKPPNAIPVLLADLAKRVPQGTDSNLHQVQVKLFGDLISKCVVPDPAERSTPEQVLVHRFLLKAP